MREILMYSGIMSETNRAAITTYLYNKWSEPPNTIPQNPVTNGTILWLDAQDITTFYQDLAGSIPTTVTDPYIKLWKDKSGFENDIWCTDGTYLTYTPDAINGLPSFYTLQQTQPNTGANSTKNTNILQSGDATLFIVGLQDEAFPFYFIHDENLNFGLGSSTSWHQSSSTNINRFTDNGTPFIFFGKMQKSQLLSGIFINSLGVQTSYAVDTLAMPVAQTSIRLNSETSVHYGEVIYYNRALTDAEIQTNATYLSNKWRIPIPTITSFSPPRISGLSLWLDSSDPYTVFETGDVLTVWKDRSGNEYDAIPHGSPTVNNGIIFDGSTQWLSLPDNALPRTEYSYYIVCKLRGDSPIISAGSKDISGQMWVVSGTAGKIIYSYDGMLWTDSEFNPFSNTQNNLEMKE